MKNQEIFQSFNGDPFLKDLLNRDPYEANKMIKIKQQLINSNKRRERLEKEIEGLTKRIDKEFQDKENNLLEINEFLKFTNSQERLNRLTYEKIKRGAMKSKEKEKKMALFKIPGEKPYEEKNEDCIERLLTPKFRKKIKLKFYSKENKDIIYRTKRIENLSNPKCINPYNTNSLYKEMMKTIDLATEQNMFTWKMIKQTKEQSFEN